MKAMKRGLDVVVVGLGQTGGRVAHEFARRGYDVLVLRADPGESSVASEPSPTIAPDRIIDIGRGALDIGVSEHRLESCMEQHAETIRQRVRALARGVDMVVVAAGLGSSTGEAVSRFLALFSANELPFFVLTTLPTASEGAVTKVAAAHAMGALLEASAHGRAIIASDRLAELHSDRPITRFFDYIHGQIVAPLDHLNRAPARDNVRVLQAIERDDLRRVLLCGGLVTWGEFEVESLTPQALLTALTEQLENSPLMPTGFDLSKVVSMVVSIEAGSDVLGATPMSSMFTFDAALKRETGGAAIARGLTEDPDRLAPLVRFAVATAALPRGLQTFVDDAAKEHEALQSMLRTPLQSLALGSLHRGAVPVARTILPAQTSFAAPTKEAPTAARTETSPESDLAAALAAEFESEQAAAGRQTKVVPRVPAPPLPTSVAPRPDTRARVSNGLFDDYSLDIDTSVKKPSAQHDRASG